MLSLMLLLVTSLTLRTTSADDARIAAGFLVVSPPSFLAGYTLTRVFCGFAGYSVILQDTFTGVFRRFAGHVYLSIVVLQGLIGFARLRVFCSFAWHTLLRRVVGHVYVYIPSCYRAVYMGIVLFCRVHVYKCIPFSFLFLQGTFACVFGRFAGPHLFHGALSFSGHIYICILVLRGIASFCKAQVYICILPFCRA